MIGVRENDVGLCSNTFEIFMHITTGNGKTTEKNMNLHGNI